MAQVKKVEKEGEMPENKRCGQPNHQSTGCHNPKLASLSLARSMKKKYKALARRAQRQMKKQSHKLAKGEEMDEAVSIPINRIIKKSSCQTLMMASGISSWTVETRASAKKLFLGKRYKHGFQKRLDAQIELLPRIRNQLICIRSKLADMKSRFKNSRGGNSKLSHTHIVQKMEDSLPGISRATIKRLLEQFAMKRSSVLTRNWGFATGYRRKLQAKFPALLQVLHKQASRLKIHCSDENYRRKILRYCADLQYLTWLQTKESNLLSLLRNLHCRKAIAAFREWMERWNDQTAMQQFRLAHSKEETQARNDRRRMSLLKKPLERVTKISARYRNQPQRQRMGHRIDRLSRQRRYTDTLVRGVFKKTLKVRFPKLPRKQKYLELMKEQTNLLEDCTKGVACALLLKHNLLTSFKRAYILLHNAISEIKHQAAQSQASGNLVTWERLLRPWTNEQRPPKPMKSYWGERLFIKLSSLPSFHVNVYECMEALMELETCDGCLPKQHLCKFGYHGCHDAIRMLNQGLEGSKVVRHILNNGIYDARARIMDILCLDTALRSVGLDRLRDVMEELGYRDDNTGKAGTSLEDRPNTDLVHFQLEWGETEEAFDLVQSDHPIFSCEWCDQLIRKSNLMTPYDSVAKVRKSSRPGFLASIRRHFGKPNLTEDECTKFLPIPTCKPCWEQGVRHGVIAPRMTENGLMVNEVPPEIASLNHYETVLIARVKNFVSCIRLKTITNRSLPDRWLLPATKGNSVNLRLTTGMTISHVAKTAPLVNRPAEAFRIYADVKTAADRVWRNIVDLQKVFKALRWLKENNHFYKDIEIDEEGARRIDPTEFVKLVRPDGRPASASAITSLGKDEGNPLPPLSQPEPFLTQEKA